MGTTANEWGGFDWLTTTNTLRIGTEHGGTGVARTIHFVIGGTPTWVITTSGHLQANTDNAYDIGASGANRPRDLHVAGQFYLGGVVRTSGGIKWNVGGTVFIESSNGVVSLQSSSGNDFGRLQLGGTTAAFPAIARSGTGIAIVAADNSQFFAISSLYQRFGTGTPEGVVNAPAGAIYHRSDGGTGTSFYVKESPSGSTGWVAK